MAFLGLSVSTCVLYLFLCSKAIIICSSDFLIHFYHKLYASYRLCELSVGARMVCEGSNVLVWYLVQK